MSVDSILSQLKPGKAYSTKEIASLCGIKVNMIRPKLQRLVNNSELVKHKAKNITYWALNPKNFAK